jgi:hypothetical protein
MPQYVLNRDYTLVGGLHRIGFKKNVPVNVPPTLVVEALRIGAQCVDGPTPSPVETPEAPKELSAEERAELIGAAISEIVEANDPESFTAAGSPAVVAVETIVGFDVSRSEVDAVWSAYRLAQSEK